MKKQAVTVTVDIPTPLYRELKAQAAARRCSVRDLILLGVRGTLAKRKRPHAARVKFPLIKSNGPMVELTNEQIHEQVEFP